MRTPTPCSCLVLLALLASAPGDVFLRIPKRPDTALEQLGGRVVQRSEVVVNGRRGRLSTFGFDQASQGVCALLAKTLDRPELAQAGATGGLWIEWPAQGEPPCQVFVLPGSGSQSLVWVVETPPDATASTPEWPWDDLPVPAGFQPAFSVAQDDGRVALVTGTLALPPEQARPALAEHLRATGWASATPAADTVATALYAKELEILATTVLPPTEGSGGPTRAAILRRRPR